MSGVMRLIVLLALGGGIASICSIPGSTQSLCPTELTGSAGKASMLQLERRGAPVSVIGKGYPGTSDNPHGFEAGKWLKLGLQYHLFITEMAGEPQEVATRLAHWKSVDQMHWHRVGTLFESTATRTGDDPRAALWAPMPIFDPDANLWNLFYIGYYSRRDSNEGLYLNYDGYVARAVSARHGLTGINGPYRNVGNILRSGYESDSWEGLQGSDSFYPYKEGPIWLGFYGSAHATQRSPPDWRVGLAASNSLQGPWHRCSALNPSPIATHFVENPVVQKLGDILIALFDVDLDQPRSIGYATSLDGVAWSKASFLAVGLNDSTVVRTPLGLISNEDGSYSLLFTAQDNVLQEPGHRPRFSSVYRIVVEVHKTTTASQ